MMLALQFLSLTFLVTYSALKWLKYYRFPKNFPPGPPCVPFLGVLPFVKGDFKSALQEWRETYGDIVGLQLGTDLAVVLSDFDTVSCAFKDPRFSGRPQSLQTVMSAFFASSPHEKNGGIVFTAGSQWSEQRRFALRTMRDFGFGKKVMDSVILEEVEKLSNVLNQKQGHGHNNRKLSHSTSLSQALSVAVVNSIWTILTGEKIPHGDTVVHEIVEGTEEFIKNESLSGPLMMLPWLLKVPVIKGKFLESKAAPLKMRKMQDSVVAKHRKKSQEELEEFGKDFIDVYLEKIEKTTDRKSSFYGDNGMLNLKRSLTDLFGAGSETSSSMLLFAFLYMIKYPDVQRKIQDEIRLATGGSKVITSEHRAKLPYTDAVLHEIMRHTCLVYTVPHATTDRVSLGGYQFPEDTAVYANVWQVMQNPDYWSEPRKFKPERFLDEKGNFRRDERCIPFMMGKRFCIGQTLALKQLFLFFAGVLNRFELQAPDGPETINTDPVVGFIHSCPEYDVVIKRREETLKSTRKQMRLRKMASVEPPREFDLNSHD